MYFDELNDQSYENQILSKIGTDALEYKTVNMIKSFTTKKYKNLTPQLLLEYGAYFNSKGEFRWAIRSIIHAHRLISATTAMSEVDLENLFPRHFLQEIGDSAQKNNISPWLFFSLIRRESLFDTVAVSSSGALGLSQLMPATGKEVAERMRLENYDFFDAQTNVSIGGYYLAMMLNRFEKPFYAAAAYNGGPTNMRNWIRQFGHLPPSLFIEAIPATQTRYYAKYVLEYSVFYGSLYWDRDPSRTVFTYLNGK
jgi:soluble lytic murein transglycosylase-like protein